MTNLLHQEQSEFQDSQIAERPDLDFTESLFLSLVQNAKSISDLIKSLSFIQSRFESRSISPIVNKNNKTGLGNLLKQILSFNRVNATPSDLLSTASNINQSWDYFCTPENILYCLLEIGIMKLRKDLSTILIKNEYSSYQILEPFLNQNLDLSDQLRNLCGLFRTVEVVYFALGVGVNRECLRLLCVESLKRQCELYEDYEYVVKVPRFSGMDALVGGGDPELWIADGDCGVQVVCEKRVDVTEDNVEDVWDVYSYIEEDF